MKSFKKKKVRETFSIQQLKDSFFVEFVTSYETFGAHNFIGQSNLLSLFRSLFKNWHDPHWVFILFVSEKKILIISFAIPTYSDIFKIVKKKKFHHTEICGIGAQM